jgi:hypothetical protein
MVVAMMVGGWNKLNYCKAGCACDIITSMKPFFISLGVLVLVHSLISFAAYRFLTKTTVLSTTDYPPVETTTADEKARGERTIVLQHSTEMARSTPMPVYFYIWSGYVGLGAAALYALYSRVGHAG